MYATLKKTVKRKLAIKIGTMLEKFSADIAFHSLPQFANRPENLTLALPRRIHGAEFMTIGNDVCIGPNSLLMAITNYPASTMHRAADASSMQEFTPQIVIGNRVSATGGLQIAALMKICVEDDVMFATNINITDALHGFEHTSEPYKQQPMFRIAPITIQRGCWIGQNTVILPGVTIGEMSIIGANSVVSHSIPPRSIAFGSPAKVVKKWDEVGERWLCL